MDRVAVNDNSIRCDGCDMGVSSFSTDYSILDTAFFQGFDSILRDISFKKSLSSELASKYKSVFGDHLYYDVMRAFRLLHCGDKLYFSSSSGKLVSANFCRDRICSLCNWRRSMRIFAHLSYCLDEISDLYGMKFIFLTLTVKNIQSDNLSGTIKLLSSAFKRFYQAKFFKKAVRGYFKSLEITYNQELKTLHPHLHVVLAVDADYFTNVCKYMDIKHIVKLWRKCLQVDYDPVCYIESIKNYSYKSVLEVSKYILKGSDFISIPDEDFVNLVMSIANVRFVSAGGIIKKYLQLDLSVLDSEKTILDNVCNDNFLVLFVWRSGLYTFGGFVPNFLT